MAYKILYLPGANAELYYTPTGDFEEYDTIDEFRNARLKHKVVYRMDTLNILVKNNVFSDYILEQFRDLLYNLITGKLDNNLENVSNILLTLYKEDDVFKTFCDELVVFEGAGSKIPFYIAFKNKIVTMLDNTYLSIQGFYSEYKQSKIVVRSHLYVYCGVDDVEQTVLIPDFMEGEVVSYAKVWKGEFEKSEW